MQCTWILMFSGLVILFEQCLYSHPINIAYRISIKKFTTESVWLIKKSTVAYPWTLYQSENDVGLINMWKLNLPKLHTIS